jgi:hypothetical protein
VGKAHAHHHHTRSEPHGKEQTCGDPNVAVPQDQRSHHRGIPEVERLEAQVRDEFDGSRLPQDGLCGAVGSDGVGGTGQVAAA